MKFDEKGVSPVIGVILMVAITVILAAVIASFVFGFSSEAFKKAPTLSLEVKLNPSDSDDVLITHMGGDIVEYTDLMVIAKYGTDTRADSSLVVVSNIDGSSNQFSPGESLRTDAGVIAYVGTWEVSVIYKPTGTVLFKGTVTRR
ncbi:type IV pilin [Archaeoglobales archaeon]|nr:MAG: type IV pilin [Archaeoglobales archaeon]